MSDETPHVNKKSVLPDEVLSSTDPGDEVQRRFRYQHTYTALIAIQMTSGKIAYKELLCEHHEDILGVRNDGKFEGIQIKTKQISDGPIELDEESVKKSLLRFINLNNDFPGSFKKFIFVSNCPTRNDGTGKSLNNLIKQAKTKKPQDSFKPSTLDKFFKWLCENSKSNEQDVINVLSIIEIQQGPSIEDIESKVLTYHLGKLEQCFQTPLPKLKIILDSIVSHIYFSSSKRIENPLQDYIAFIDGNEQLLDKVYINIKRVSIDSINRLITEPLTKNLFLSSRKGPPIQSNSSTSDLMFYKMQCGLIEEDSIEIMDDLRASSETYILNNYYKTKNPAETLKQLDQIRTIVKNQAIESKSRSKLKGTPFGVIMLHDLEDRLEKIVENRHRDVYETPYEILKGIVGILTNECKVAFSEEPTGGWKKAWNNHYSKE
ncbi:dsDNA nuclease domain-containing protein [Sediminibacillus sp. JSM 1682029]|uniref:dsDNA nuclease domain-containing protein n=1 Tax=Sediminibacillus sp. JSM 1682029 TaxID=3229857 RepID=UPI0035264D79